MRSYLFPEARRVYTVLAYNIIYDIYPSSYKVKVEPQKSQQQTANRKHHTFPCQPCYMRATAVFSPFKPFQCITFKKAKQRITHSNRPTHAVKKHTPIKKRKNQHSCTSQMCYIKKRQLKKNRHGLADLSDYFLYDPANRKKG